MARSLCCMACLACRRRAGRFGNLLRQGRDVAEPAAVRLEQEPQCVGFLLVPYQSEASKPRQASCDGFAHAAFMCRSPTRPINSQGAATECIRSMTHPVQHHGKGRAPVCTRRNRFTHRRRPGDDGVGWCAKEPGTGVPSRSSCPGKTSSGHHAIVGRDIEQLAPVSAPMGRCCRRLCGTQSTLLPPLAEPAPKSFAKAPT